MNGSVALADGVLEEAKLAKAAGAFLLPIGTTGGAAKVIADGLLGSVGATIGPNAIRPTDSELRALGDPSADAAKLVDITTTILKRLGKTY